MAVETPHMSLNFPSQLITNRDLVKANQANMNLYNTQMDSGLVFNEPVPETLMSFYQSSLGCDPISAAKASNKDDSSLTYNVPAVAAPRKRARDSINDDNFDAFHASQKTKVSPLSSFIDHDILFQIQQQQSEIDRFIDDHNQKVRMELEERKKRQSRMLVSAIQEGMIKKMKEKDEEIQRMGKINWFLQEKAKSLYVENQIWRDLAQANEATANSLRSNLEQVLAHASGGAAPLADDAESSCCGSSDHGRCTLAGGEEGAVKDKMVVVKDNLNHSRMCKKCGERESSVLLLPCRHLCLCTLCGSNLIGSCPVCDSAMTASVHVNMS
ncbi:hypothetical protein D5086_027348 [Populus alba]|uniref:Uncharacterized protein n=3 Tax=Populus TaxID=3689 RepID=A0ACC4AV23_POPAL|nr:BOI-related E3 ubiquitin-protein ligase 1-like [Populus alba]KAJ6970998.1 BOI-related E3 ubiquitin-protein ligase 1-like [Populus alba x Populus x berolinensis]TKS01375.1 hypothetical protein D5086_0000173850 [Populus alba]